jgi:hypothetical protein
LVPFKREDFFRDPPLLLENYEDYPTVAKSTIAALQPRYSVEMVFVRGFVDHVWCTERYERFKTAVIDAAQLEGIRSFVRDLTPKRKVTLEYRPDDQAHDHRREVEERTWKWYAGGTSAQEQVQKIFNQ